MRAMACAFNRKFFQLGCQLIESFSKHHPDYPVFCWVVNCSKHQRDYLDQYPNVRVILGRKKINKNSKMRAYMTTHRFSVWSNLLQKHREVKEWVALDGDVVIEGCIDPLYDLLQQYDILLDYRGKKKKDMIAGGCLAYNNSSIVRKYFKNYTKAHRKMIKLHGWRWYDDQRCLYKAMKHTPVNWGTVPPIQKTNKSDDGSILQLRGNRKWRYKS